jgi:predicted AlkP superfamily pyrophosphatase or phosphodiesterase
VLDVVGLTGALLGPDTPNLLRLAQNGRRAAIRPAFPAVTCTVQATYLTGTLAHSHGIVGNGWYNRELAEVQFWKQSNHLVAGRKLWEELRELKPGYRCAKLFWWFNMYSSADYSITPRPTYPADGRKIPDIYSAPLSIRDEIKRDLGEFPFQHFWGPFADIESSRWIADAARWIEERYAPDLSLIYLPHLDYNLQRVGPAAIVSDLRLIDQVVGSLVNFFHSRDVQVAVLSEYGITPVNNPIHLNRLFRMHGWLVVKNELGRELLDCGASAAFAVADHQVAHVYINERPIESDVRRLLESVPGVHRVLGAADKGAVGIDHPRAGDLVAVADQSSWFTYYYWQNDSVAPDFARTIDIHRKPGYDPVELFVDPNIGHPKLRLAWFLAQKKLGFRALLDIVPLDAELVHGSHGRVPENIADWPVLLLDRNSQSLAPQIEAAEIYGALRDFCATR